MNSKRGNTLLVSVSIMLATIMQILDTTIANVALPHMRGSLSAGLDQIAWVLTSYIVASAIMTLPVGYLAQRFGRRRVLLWSVTGFTLASMLCGQASSLEEMVTWRILQGVLGASVAPLSQAVLLDSFPREKHATAMSIWGMGVMVAPVLGPILGGWLTEYYSWRWVFYINLPLGLISIAGIYFFLEETEPRKEQFDLTGFALLALVVASTQLLLDRGEQVHWFDALEIQLYLVAVCLGLYLFLVHARSAKKLFLSPVVFRDVNFVSGLVLIFVVGMVMLGSMALIPSYLQQWKNYPVDVVGTLLIPRGIGTILTMSMVSPLLRLFDERALIAVGMGTVSLSLFIMAGFTIEVESHDVIVANLIQGLGMGLVTVPTTTLAFTTLPPQNRNEGAALYSLMRNLGASVGVSVSMSLLTRNMWINQQQLGERLQISPSLLYELPPGQQVGSLPGEILWELNRQAAEISYVNDFQLLAYLTLATIPLVLLLRVQTNRQLLAGEAAA